jgi:protein-disulfide isomerase
MKNPWVVLGIIVVLLLGGAIWYSSKVTSTSNEGVTITEHIKGNKDATVTLVEYSDLQCPACASFQPVLQTVLDTYGDRLRFEYKHFPLPIHQYAQQAAIAAEAASQQGKFFEFHDKLFAEQKTWSASPVPQTFFVAYATDLGLDVELFKRHLKSSLLRDKVKQDLEDARKLELTGTPTFFLNGKKMEFDSFESFVNQIAQAIDPTIAPLQASSTEAVRFGL